MPGVIGQLLPIVLMLGLFYAVIFIPENKRKKKYNELLSNLKANDEVLTRGGIMGKIINVKDNYVIIETGPERARLKLSKQGIASIIENSNVEDNK